MVSSAIPSVSLSERRWASTVLERVLNLLKDLQAQLGLTYLFVAHNLAVVAHISDRIGVMYLGKMVELGTTSDIYDHPMHPYTKALLSATVKEGVCRMGKGSLGEVLPAQHAPSNRPSRHRQRSPRPSSN